MVLDKRGVGRPAGGKPVKKVFFKNVTFETSAGFLLKKFKAFGHVNNLDLWKLADGRSKGMGTVEFSTAEEAEDAVRELCNVEIDGRPMFVELEDPAKTAAKGEGKGEGKGPKGSHKVFFKNVLFETSAGFLMGLFRKFGYVIELDLWKHLDGRSKGCGTVEYGFAHEAKAAVNGLEGLEVDRRPLRVEFYEDNGKGGGKGAADGPRRLFFRNVLFETTAGFLMGLFKKHGYVVELDLRKTPDGRSRGMGTVEFGHAAEARAALAALDGFEVDGRPLMLEIEDSSRSDKGGKGWKGDGKGWSDGKGANGSRLIFKNLLFETPPNFMLGLFRQHGYVQGFEMWKTQDGRSKGIGTIEFSHPSEAHAAIEALDGAEVDGRVITVEFDSSWAPEGKGGKGPPIPTRVFFKNILFETPHEFLLSLFRKHGPVADFTPWTYADGRPKGMGTAEFKFQADARSAVQALNGAEVDGRVITVELEDARMMDGKGYDAGPAKGKGKGAGKVFFKNVLFETTPGFLMGRFKQFGYVVQLDLWKHPDGRSKGMGTVVYNSTAEARAAVEGLNGSEVDGRPMFVELEDSARGGAAVAPYAPVRAKGKGGKPSPY